MSDISTTTVAVAIGVFAIAAVGIYAKSRKRSRYTDTDTVRSEQGEAQTVRKQAEDSSAQERQREYEAAKDDFYNNASAFVGIYEVLHRVSEGRSRNNRNAIMDWNTRIDNMDSAPSLRKLWQNEFPGIENYTNEEFQKTAATFMGILSDFGLRRIAESELVVDDETYKHYSTDDGNIIVKGNRVKVTSPYWLLGEGVIEKGEITAIESE